MYLHSSVTARSPISWSLSKPKYTYEIVFVLCWMVSFALIPSSRYKQKRWGGGCSNVASPFANSNWKRTASVVLVLCWIMLQFSSPVCYHPSRDTRMKTWKRRPLPFSESSGSKIGGMDCPHFMLNFADTIFNQVGSFFGSCVVVTKGAIFISLAHPLRISIQNRRDQYCAWYEMNCADIIDYPLHSGLRSIRT